MIVLLNVGIFFTTSFWTIQLFLLHPFWHGTDWQPILVVLTIHECTCLIIKYTIWNVFLAYLDLSYSSSLSLCATAFSMPSAIRDNWLGSMLLFALPYPINLACSWRWTLSLALQKAREWGGPAPTTGRAKVPEMWTSTSLSLRTSRTYSWPNKWHLI